MPSTTNERKLLKEMNRGKAWSDKVDRMTDSQVIEVFMRLKVQGKIK